MWYARVRRTSGGEWMAWCAPTPDLGRGPLDVAFDKAVHFEFAPTPWEALVKLRSEVEGPYFIYLGVEDSLMETASCTSH